MTAAPTRQVVLLEANDVGVHTGGVATTQQAPKRSVGIQLIRVFPKIAALDGHALSLQGIKAHLRGSYGRKPNVVFVPLSDRDWELQAGRDPWAMAREFLHLALADSGAFGFERDIERMEAPNFEMLYFEPFGPSVRYWRPGQPAPQAI